MLLEYNHMRDPKEKLPTKPRILDDDNCFNPLLVCYANYLCCMLSCSVMSEALRPHGLQAARHLCPWGFSRQEYSSGLTCPPPGNLPNPGIELKTPTLQADAFLIWATRKINYSYVINWNTTSYSSLPCSLHYSHIDLLAIPLTYQTCYLQSLYLLSLYVACSSFRYSHGFTQSSAQTRELLWWINLKYHPVTLVSYQALFFFQVFHINIF